MPSSVENLASLLRYCTCERSFDHALHLHVQMCAHGLEAHLPFGSQMVAIFAEFGRLCHAQQAFDVLLHRDEFAWDSLILAQIRSRGQPHHAFFLYQKMQQLDFLLPSSCTVLALVKLCAERKDLERGCQIHADILSRGLSESDSSIHDGLIDMYLKCDSLGNAQELFNNDKCPVRNVVLWTALITGYIEHGHGDAALTCFHLMLRLGISPDVVAYICVLKACGMSQAVDGAHGLHTDIIMRGFESDLHVSTTLIDMYAKCDLMEIAEGVFEKLAVRNVVMWNALIAGSVEHGDCVEALELAERMQCEAIAPDDVTFVCSLKACRTVRDKCKGQSLHMEIINRGLEGFQQIGNALIDLYVKIGLLREAKQVFDNLGTRSVVSWNAMISGYIEHNRCDAAIDLFERLEKEACSPDAITFIFGLRACRVVALLNKLHKIHIKITKCGFEFDFMVGSTLIDTYAEYGTLEDAQVVFEQLSARNVVSWNALIAGFNEQGRGEETLQYFEYLQNAGVFPLDATFLSISKACGDLGIITKGQQLHSEIIIRGYEGHMFLGNALVDMYTNCGAFVEACKTFDDLTAKDEVSWNALITGYALIGEDEDVLQIFEEMVENDVKPNLVTFLSILHACSHAGKVERGWHLFRAISQNFGLIPAVEHHACMIDLLGRSGHLENAIWWMKWMPVHASTVLWHALLGASRKWCNPNIGKYAFRHAIELDKQDAGAYICMFNIYMDGNMHKEAHAVEEMRAQHQVSKQPVSLFDWDRF